MVDTSHEIIPDGFYKNKLGAICSINCSCGKKNQEVDDCLDCKPKALPIGWTCSVCGRGNNPSNTTCPCVEEQKSCGCTDCKCKS